MDDTVDVPMTDRAKRVLSLAAEEALRMKHDSIRSEHLLIGLTVEGAGVAAKVLREFDADVPSIRSAVTRMTPPGETEPPRICTLSEETEQLLHRAHQEAQGLHHMYVGTEHLLMSFARFPDCVAYRALNTLGLDPDSLRQDTLELLGHGR